MIRLVGKITEPVYCPLCRQKMQKFTHDNQWWWDCLKCESLFKITQMAWYPIKKEED